MKNCNTHGMCMVDIKGVIILADLIFEIILVWKRCDRHISLDHGENIKHRTLKLYVMWC